MDATHGVPFGSKARGWLWTVSFPTIDIGDESLLWLYCFWCPNTTVAPSHTVVLLLLVLFSLIPLGYVDPG